MQQMTMFGLNQPEFKKETQQRKANELSDHEYLESIGQINLFDYYDVGQDCKRTRKLLQGDKVKLRFYIDEIDYIASSRPQMLENGTVIECFDECYAIEIAGDLIKVDGEKLLLL